MTPLEQEVRSRKYLSLRFLPLQDGERIAILDHGFNLITVVQNHAELMARWKEFGPKQGKPCTPKQLDLFESIDLNLNGLDLGGIDL